MFTTFFKILSIQVTTFVSNTNKKIYETIYETEKKNEFNK